MINKRLLKSTSRNTVIIFLVVVMMISLSTAAFASDHEREHENNGRGHGNGHGNVKINFHFSDMNQAQWALKDIESLEYKKVFTGYNDGTFKPNQYVTRTEAITAAVRLLGLDSKAQSEKNTKLNFKDANLIKSKYKWAVGYIAVALENELFSTSATRVDPGKPASRIWSTVLMVKALKLQREAEAHMNDQLPFRDANQIPAGSRGYVAVAMQKGLIHGYPNNTFLPNRPVTRAELAVMLDRTNNQLPGSQNETIQGTLTSPVSNDTLYLSVNGQSVQLPVDPNAIVYSGNTRLQLSDLTAGEQIVVRYFNNQVVFIQVIQSTTTQNGIIKGTVISAISGGDLSLYINNQTVTLPLADNVFVYRNGQIVAISQIQSGDQVSAVVANGKVALITILASNVNQNGTVTGTLFSLVNNNQLTLTQNNQVKSYPISSNVSVIINGIISTLSNLNVGDQITATLNNNQVFIIQATSSTQQNGTINGTVLAPVSNNKLSLSVSGQAKTVTLSSSVTVYNKGQQVTISDIATGDQVMALLSNGVAAYINITSTANQNGTVTGTLLTPVSNNLLTLTVNNQTLTYPIASNVSVIKDGKISALNYLNVGDQIKATLNKNQIIIIEDTSSSHPDGTVNGTVVAPISNTQLILTVNNQTLGYTLASNVSVFRNGQQVSISDITAGDQVQAVISNGQVIYINITSTSTAFTIDGTLNMMTVNSSGKITTITVTHRTYGQGTISTLYNVSSNATIIGDITQLVYGHAIEVQGQNQIVYSIQIK